MREAAILSLVVLFALVEIGQLIRRLTIFLVGQVDRIAPFRVSATIVVVLLVTLTITLRAWRRGDRWTLTLSDNGSGIPRAERAHVFAPLGRGAGTTAPGSGLGLTLARQAIEACGGSIAVSSRPGVGTSFAITLRAAERR